MELQREENNSKAIKLFLNKEGKEVGRVMVYLIYNQLHEEPYGLLEDVYVEESERGSGLGTKLALAAIEEARKAGCYKIICTSRHAREKVHNWYKKLGFYERGLEFRIDLK